jgi:DNA-binding PadR family transcriptional regulator
MKQPDIEFADTGWVAITRNEGGRVGLKPVRMFELTAEGVTALTKNANGTMVPDPDVIEVINTDPLHAAKLAWMHKLVGVADRATTSAEFDAVERLADFVMNWGPRNGG